jgi:methylmalonyl-CoA mutase cobalamin-binding subunit
MPNRGEVMQRISELQSLAKAAGRSHIPVTVYPNADAEEIERFAEAGVDRCIFYVPPDGRDPALRKLDELAHLVRPFVPE